MSRSDRTEHRFPTTLHAKGAVASLLIHLLGASGLLAAWLATDAILPRAGDRDSGPVEVVLVLDSSRLAPLPAELHPARSEVLISPRKAQLADRAYFRSPSRDVELREMLSPEVFQAVLDEKVLLEEETPPIRQEQPNPPRPPRRPLLEAFPEKLPERRREIAETKPDPPVKKQDPPVNKIVQPQPKQSSPANSNRANLRAPDFSGNQPPRYPAAAVRQRLEGVVMLRLTLAADGQVTDVKVVTSSGHPILDAAAVSTVRTWRAAAPQRDGRPVATVWDLPVRFRLN